MLIPLGILDFPVAAGSYELIATEILTSSQASISFDVTGLDSKYQHLQIRLAGRSSATSDNDNFFMRLNGDSATNYSSHRLQTDGSTFTTSGYSNQTDMRNLGVLPAANSTANLYAGAVIDLVDIFSTSKFKTVRSISASNSKDLLALTSGNWRSTAALTSVDVHVLTGSWVANTRMSIYGIRSN